MEASHRLYRERGKERKPYLWPGLLEVGGRQDRGEAVDQAFGAHLIHTTCDQLFNSPLRAWLQPGEHRRNIPHCIID
jgi:hypothetical protein